MNRLVPAALIVLFFGLAVGAGFGELRDDVGFYPDEPPPEGFKLNMRLAEPSLPVPPEQAVPWKPPATKFSKRFVEAVATLFRQGLADPRGCQYDFGPRGSETRTDPRPIVFGSRFRHPSTVGGFAVCQGQTWIAGPINCVNLYAICDCDNPTLKAPWRMDESARSIGIR